MKYTLDEQTEIMLLKSIIILCRVFGAKIRMTRKLYRKECQIFIDLKETALNIWLDNERIIAALQELLKEETA